MGNIIQFRRARSFPRRRNGATSPIFTILVGLVIGACIGCAIVFGAPLSSATAEQSTFSARFGLCHTGGGTNCVVDGDTFWLAGEKIRIMDIDAPETHPPRCAAEANLGNRATARLQELLSKGPFEMISRGKDSDRYGRKLRIVVRNGTSIGAILVDEGLAREWTGSRQPWC